MEKLIELQEAKKAAQEVIATIDVATSSLKSASTWGIFDILGGGLFASLVKRDKIKDVNEDIQSVYYALNLLNRELKDIDEHFPTEISNTLGDNILDVYFDNIFTDLRVQGEIKQELTQLKELRSSISDLIQKLDLEIEELK